MANNITGETQQPLHHRVNIHCFNITLRRTEESHLVDHFNDEGHTLVDMTLTVLDQLYSHDPCLHRIRESQVDQNPGDFTPIWMNIRVHSL